MAAITLATFRARARERADMTNSTFITDGADSLDAWINQGIGKLHEMLFQVYGADYFEKEGTINLVAGTSDYTLPSDFLKLLGVDLVRGDQRYTLKPYQRSERNAARNMNLFPFEMPQYKLTQVSGGPGIRILPATLSDTLYVQYVPEATKLVNGSDSVNYPQGWHERFVPVYAAIQALRKEESDPTTLLQELSQIEEDIRRAADKRDVGAPQQVSDVYNDGNWWPW